MRTLLLQLALLLSSIAMAQTVISGTVTDAKHHPIMGANVYLDGTYDGATTNELGEFSFKTDEAGAQTLTISYMSYETQNLVADVSHFVNLQIKLLDNMEGLDTVVISAGSFEANDNSKVSVLKPMDVVTTASALGDFVGALQTLPGTSTVSEDGRLFVRGGDASETQIFIDGIRVFTPYKPTANNVPTRGRYSPFLFDGFSFSTGGYSAEYGNALSSVLLLNTIDEADQEKTEIGIMSVGGKLGHTEKWDRSSLSVNATYFNLAPYNAIFRDRNDWKSPYETAQGEAVFRQKFDTGIFKIYAAFDATNFELVQDDINFDEGVRFKLNNQNFYTNASYQGTLGKSWSIHSGVSYTVAKTNLNVIADEIKDDENSAHFKLKLKKRFNSRFKLSFGAEQFLTHFDEAVVSGNFADAYGYRSNISAAYAESDLIFSKKLAMKVGLRANYFERSEEVKLAPRFSVAYKTSKNAQLSLAFGQFFQNASAEVLKLASSVETQNTQHYILNYQFVNDGRLFRAELYRKTYNNLVKYDSAPNVVATNFNNNGDGYAQGLDLFFRDNKSVKNVDYWLSYSFLDTERDYKNYPTSAQPDFANTHNFSAVGKYWITDWKSQVGLAYNFASGRAYTNPNTEAFLSEKTKSYNSLSLNWAYLLGPQKILYLSVNNVLGFKNVNGYQYADTLNANGNFSRSTLQPAADQFFFVGFFLTISDDGKDNQLNDL